MKSIAVIFGGKSAEHDVSIITAHTPIIDTLEASGKFDVWPIYITKEGKWYCDKRMNDLSFFKNPAYEDELKSWKTVDISVNDGFTIIWPGLMRKTQKIDIVFPSMHGTYGEDGSLMGLLRMANVPFVGCDMFASAVAMDKVLTKQVVAAEGMPIVPYVWFTKSQWNKEKEVLMREIKKLAFPLFVKPVHLGSSIGMAKVKAEKELEQAIDVALHYDNKVLVEEGIDPLIEITLPIMGNDEIRCALPERPLNKTDFFDFNDKYLSGGKKGGGSVNSEYSEIPAKIEEDLTKQILDLGTRVYRALDCGGIARVDFLIHAETKTVYVNEVNTLPGSLYAHNWKKAGVSNMDLVLELVKLAEERFAAQKDITHAFQSDILKKVGGPKVQT
ncbi:MAG TPA: D-alanine--D-alanine ligase family protein [Candidatus Paceibacterota bacterium]